MGGNKGHGGVLELGELGTRVPEFSRDGSSNPRLTGGFSGGHDGQPLRYRSHGLLVNDSDDKTRLGKPRRQRL